MGSHLNRQLWIGFSVIVASIAIAAIAFYLLTGHIDTAVAQIVADQALVEQQTGALGVVAQLKQQAPQAAIYQAAMDKLLPAQDGLIGFTQWVSGIATQDQVTTSVSFQGSGAPSPGVSGGQTGFSISVGGGINNIIAFLNDIESKVPGFLLQLTSFDLTNQNGTYQLTAQGNLFYR
jgi:hypothetical protein